MLGAEVPVWWCCCMFLLASFPGSFCPISHLSHAPAVGLPVEVGIGCRNSVAYLGANAEIISDGLTSWCVHILTYIWYISIHYMSGDSRTFVLGSPKIYAREHKSVNCYLVVLACTAVHLWSGLQCLSLPQAFPSGPWRPAASRVVTESAEAQLHSKHRTSLFFVELSGPGAAIWSQTFASTWLMRRYALLLCPTYCIHFTKEVSRHSKFQMLFDDDVHTYYIIILYHIISYLLGEVP